MIIVISGPGGVGKGTVVKRLIERDGSLWLSRSWTTRERRPNEPATAYTFASRAEFEDRLAAGGFLEHNEFLGNLYGTPVPDTSDAAGSGTGARAAGSGPADVVGPGSRDVVLEIDVNGARQVLQRDPSALVLFVVAPSPDEQEARLRKRGDPDDKVAQRLAVTREEVAAAEALGATFIVNDDLERTVDEILDLIRRARAER